MTDTLWKTARLYAKAGYPVLPVWGLRRDKTCRCPKGAQCASAGKHAIEKEWQKRATTDPDKAEAIFKRYPEAHIGVMPPAGCCILDVDPRNGGFETLRAVMGSKKLTRTVIQKSGGGGLHIFYKGVPNGPLGKGIDIKAHGKGYVVASPAGHTSGGAYEWKHGCTPWERKIAALPKCFSGGKRPTKEPLEPKPRPTLQAVRAALAFIPADDYGTWIKYGQALRHDFGESGRAVWLEWARKSEKWQDADAKRWTTFDRNAGANPVTVATIMAEAKKFGFAPEFSTISASPSVATIEVQRSVDIAVRDLPPLKEFVPNMVTAGLTLIAGRAKLGKSWLMLNLTIVLSRGGQFLGLQVVRARVLYLALEDSPRRMKSRMEKLGATSNFDVTFQAPRMDQGLPAELSRLIEKHGYEVIIIDTLAAISPASNAGKGVWAGDYGVVAALQQVATEHNVAILLVTHTKKNADKGDAQDAIVTTTGVLAGADAYWVFQKPGQDMLLTVRGRDIQEDEYALRFDRDTATWEMLGRAGQVVKSSAQQKILEVMRANPQPFKWGELKKASGTGDAFDIGLKRLVARRLVEQSKDGRYSLVDEFGGSGHGR